MTATSSAWRWKLFQYLDQQTLAMRGGDGLSRGGAEIKDIIVVSGATSDFGLARCQAT